MRNFSAAECGKVIRGNLRNVPHLLFRKLPLGNFPHSAKYPRPHVASSQCECDEFTGSQVISGELGLELAKKSACIAFYYRDTINTINVGWIYFRGTGF